MRAHPTHVPCLLPAPRLCACATTPSVQFFIHSKQFASQNAGPFFHKNKAHTQLLPITLPHQTHAQLPLPSLSEFIAHSSKYLSPHRSLWLPSVNTLPPSLPTLPNHIILAASPMG